MSVTEELFMDTDPGPGAVEILLSVGAGLTFSGRVLTGTLTVVRINNDRVSLICNPLLFAGADILIAVSVFV